MRKSWFLVIALLLVGHTANSIAAKPEVDNPKLLKESGEIRGTVQCTSGSPAVGASVYIPGKSFLARTDEDGGFALLYVPEGEYSLLVEVAGHTFALPAVEVLKKKIAQAPLIIVTCPQTCVPAAEVCDGSDNDCDGLIDEEDVCTPGPVCGNGQLEAGEDCDGVDLGGASCQSLGFAGGGALTCAATCQFDTSGCSTTCPDADHDGFPSGACGGLDCNDSNPSINPVAPEQCDGLDNDCDGLIDENFDFSTDVRNCGGCGIVCSPGQSCTAGICTL